MTSSWKSHLGPVAIAILCGIALGFVCGAYTCDITLRTFYEHKFNVHPNL